MDPASERYFASFRAAMAMNRDSVPTSYSSVDEGLATPVRSQQTCGNQSLLKILPHHPSGSCVAFSNMAVIEICFAKTAGVLGEYLAYSSHDNINNVSGLLGATAS